MQFDAAHNIVYKQQCMHMTYSYSCTCMGLHKCSDVYGQHASRLAPTCHAEYTAHLIDRIFPDTHISN